MSSARSDFINRLAAFRDAVSLPEIVDQAPSQVAHNRRAAVLRNGLAVVGFSTLEGFIRNRAAEVLDDVASAGVSFGDLSDQLQQAATLEAVRALRIQAEVRWRQKEDYVTYIQTHSAHIASTSSTPFSFSPVSLGWTRPNLAVDDVKDILKALGVADGWGNLTRFAQRVGLSSLSLRDAFRNAAMRRHRAAHRPDAQTSPADLSAFCPEAMGIGLAFDAFATRFATEAQTKGATQILAGLKTLNETNLTLRFVRPSTGGRWREVREGATRATRTGSVKATVVSDAEIRAAARGEVLVVLDTMSWPETWSP